MNRLRQIQDTIMQEVIFLINNSSTGVRFLASVSQIIMGIALLLRDDLFEGYTSYEMLRNIPEPIMGIIALVIGIGLAILPKNRWRSTFLLLTSAWWLYWILVVAWSNGFTLFAAVLTGMYAGCLLEYWHPANKAQRRGEP